MLTVHPEVHLLEGWIQKAVLFFILLCSLLVQRKKTDFWHGGDGSVGKVLVPQAGGPEVGTPAGM